MTRTPPLRLLVALLGVAILVGAAPPLATPPSGNGTATAESGPPTAASIEQARAEIAERLATARRAVEGAGSTASPAAVREAELLERIDLLLQQQAEALRTAATAEADRAQTEQTLATQRASGPPDAPPFSFLALDALRDELETERLRGTRLASGVEGAREAIVQARRSLDEKERARRAAREASETNKDDAKKAELETVLRLARLESRAATEQLRLRELAEANEQLAQAVYDLRLTLLQERIAWLERRTPLSEEEARRIQFDLDTRGRTLRTELDAVERDAEFFESQWFEAKRRRDTAPADAVGLTEEVEARRLAHDALRRQSGLIGQRIERLDLVRTAWDRRVLAVRGVVERVELRQWESETRRVLDRLRLERQLQEADVNNLRQQIVTLDGRMEADVAPAAARWLREQKAQLERHVGFIEGNLGSIESARRVHQRLLDQVTPEVSKVTLRDRLRSTREWIAAAWAYELTSVDDRPITVGKVVIGLMLVLIGIFASRFIARLLGRRLLPRIGMAESGAAAIQTLLFYVLVTTFALLALRIVNVPLTVFTILGGALAIGVGFGSQNLINNFISGLMLLAERPVRVGDLIQIGDLHALVQHIGARSTRVRTGDNVDIVVPNSRFLEENVINWTLNDTTVRIHVTVGVVYGAPTREVQRLLLKAVEEHGRVLKSPAPIVLFTDFGDNALMFEVHFWIRMKRIMDRRSAESDIRFRIDALFREAHIVIAFPQRDVHLDTLRPLEVRMVTNPPGDDAGH